MKSLPRLREHSATAALRVFWGLPGVALNHCRSCDEFTEPLVTGGKTCSRSLQAEFYQRAKKKKKIRNVGMTVEAMVNDRSGISESWSETELLT